MVLNMTDMQKYFEDFYNANNGHLEKAEENQIKVWNNEKVDTQPLLLSCSLSDEQKEKMTYYDLKEIHNDNEKMMLSSMPALPFPIQLGWDRERQRVGHR